MQKNSSRIILILLKFIIVTSACNTKECFTPPENFRMIIIDENTGLNLISEGYYQQDSIKIYYLDNFDEIELIDLEISNFISFSNVLISKELPWKSCINSIKTYYLYLDQNDIDTLFIDVAVKNDDGCTWHEYNEVRFNDKIPTYNKDLGGYELIKTATRH